MYKLITIVCIFLSIVNQVEAKKKKPTPETSKPASNKVSFADKIKPCKQFPGLFPVYQDTTNGSVYLVIKKEHINNKFIYFSYSENGVVAAGHFKGGFRGSSVFVIKRYFDKIEFVKENTRFYFDSTNAISKAADANISHAILVSQKIIAEEGEQILLDGNSIFLSENLSQIKPTPMPGPMGSMSLLGNLSKDKTKVNKVRNYANNTDVIVDYVYDNPSPLMSGGSEVTDSRSINITYQHSFIKAPEVPMEPRADDQRIGYFNELVNDMTATDAIGFRDIIHRWRLEKKDKNASISEPVKPITWWIENTTPHELRPIIKAAGLQWNLAFEKAGFKNAVQIFEQPDSASWDAGDIGYNVLRWTSSPQPPFGGYGPSFVDPRTGEILGADIMLEYIFLTNRMKQEKLFDAKIPNGLEMLDQHVCDAGHHLHQSTLFGNYMADINSIESFDKREYMKQSLFYLIMHEMGHTLGLMHNMKASQLWNPIQSHDTSLTRNYGLIASVMDYPSVNVSADPKKQGDYFTTRPGPYDMWAIYYGYSEGLANAANEKVRLDSVLSQSDDPMLIFGNDADDMRSPGKGVDPRVNINDFSNDAIGYGIERINMVNAMLPNLPAKYMKPGSSNQELKQAYAIASTEVLNAVNAISRYIGGVYIDRNMKGKGNAYTPVELKDQKKAMAALSQYLFSPDAVKASEKLYGNLQSQRRGFNFFGSADDPKIHDRVLMMQEMVIDHLLAPTTLKRITDSRLYGNKYPAVDMMTELTNACFKQDLAGNVNTFRQNLQLSYVKSLCDMLDTKGPGNRYDNIARSAALLQLKNIKTMMATPAVNQEVKAHREHVLFVINQILESKKS